MTTLKTLFFALAVGLLPLDAHAAELGIAHVSLLDGDVQVKVQDSGEWLPAATNMPLASGDRLWVPARGRVELQLRDGSYVRLNEYSALEILALERDSFQFYLTSGQGYVNFKGRRDYFLQLDTPVAALRLYDKATFSVEVADNSDTRVTVIKGAVEAENRHERLRLSAGKTLMLRGDASPERYATAPADDWERWNMRRDGELYERRESARYLPNELESYAPDLDAHGRWVNNADYGSVWIPSVHISVGWSPYQLGRWVWIGGDYVWISHEPWGWAPYHYGRWAFAGHLGWFWIPPLRGAVYWGPGFVGWSHHNNHVAWVPLAPGEIYYGHGHYGPHSVNLLNVDIHKTIVKHDYRNAHVHNGVTTLHRDSFLTGRPMEVRLKENLFLTGTARLGRPDLKPERATRLPVIKEIPRTQLPPSAIRDLPMREARPLVKDRSTPVLRGEARERTTPAATTREQAVGQPKQGEQRPGLRPTERAPESRESRSLRSFEIPPAGEKSRPDAPAPRSQDVQPRPAREPMPVQSFPGREQRSGPTASERRPEAGREPQRLKEAPSAVAPAQLQPNTPPRQREAPQQKPLQQTPPAPDARSERRLAAPAPERPVERLREIKKPPEAQAPEAVRKSAPVQPAKEKLSREEQDKVKVNEGIKFR